MAVANRALGPAAGMALGTSLSRATGFLRTVALATALGVTATSDAYNTANTAPMMLFTLVAGGALSASVVPLLLRADGRRGEVASVLLGVTLVGGVVLSAGLALAAPLLFRALAAGAGTRTDHEAYVSLGTSWLRMFAPQVALYALSVLAVAVMTARRRLALGATAPVLTNILTSVVAVAYVYLVGSRPDGPALVPASGRLLLGWGTTAAVASMVALQLWGAWRCEPGWRPTLQLRHPAVRELVRAGGWVLVYVATNQVGLAVVISTASGTAGGVTAYQWGFMVMQLPYAIVAVSLLSAALPSIATRDGNTGGAALAASTRSTITWLVPAAVGLGLAAGPVAVVLVGANEATLVTAAISGFAVSLLPFSIFQLLTRTSYALGDARAPAMVNVGVNVVNIACALATAAWAATPVSRVAGLALSHAASYVVGCVALAPTVLRHLGLTWGTVVVGHRRLLVAALPLGAATVALSDPLDSLQSRWGAAVAVAGICAVVVILPALWSRAFGGDVRSGQLAGTVQSAGRP